MRLLPGSIVVLGPDFRTGNPAPPGRERLRALAAGRLFFDGFHNFVGKDKRPAAGGRKVKIIVFVNIL
ncbi:MAG: hypothetical protein P8Y36_09355, partial [Alphaproteobacteria bacterium]